MESSVSFRVDLFDKFEEVDARVNDGRKWLATAVDFLTKQAALEKEYSKKLMALCKTTDQDFGTVANAWNVVREETENRARFHSDLGDAINSAVATPLKELLRVTEANRKKGRDAAKKLLTDLNRTEKTLDEAKAKYERARKKQFECKDEYERASFNANGNPKLKEKLSKQLSSQHKAADQADTSYAEQVSKLQELQVKCYETEVPAVLADFERMERSRIDAVKSAFEQYVRLEERLAPLVTDSLLRMSAVVEALNAETDVVEFVRLTKSGQMPPARAQYHPFDEAAGRCLAPASSISVGFQPGGRRPGHGSAVVVVEASSPRGGSTTPTGAASPRGGAGASGGGSRVASTPALTSGPRAPHVVITKPPIMGKCAALYDYDAQSEQELSFKAGDVISILDKDESGWWHGELNGRVGVFPAAEWVEEIDENAPPAPRDAPGELKELAQAAELAQCVSLYDYAAQDEDELSIVEGEILNIEYEDSGWYIGSNLKGQSGRFPSNFCQILEQ